MIYVFLGYFNNENNYVVSENLSWINKNLSS